MSLRNPNEKINDLGFHHGTFEAATTGGCKCDVCVKSLESYCNPNGIPMCTRLPGHVGEHTTYNKDRVLDQLAQDIWEMNISTMDRVCVTDKIRRYQS